MEKKVKCNKDHECSCCERIIPKGEYAFYMEGRVPKFADDHETQIGIQYWNCWLHINSSICEKFLDEDDLKAKRSEADEA